MAFRDQRRDLVVYGLLADEWRARRPDSRQDQPI
jgi:RimJ/RimL family protein N-acetyltransferase